MKLTKLLFMGTVLAAGTGVSATVVDGVRQKPVPQKSAMQFGKAMYLYNVGAKQFFRGANDYQTRGSVADLGYKVWFSKHLNEAGEWDNASVIFKDSVENQKAIKMVWQAANGDVWVDWASQADTLWTLSSQAGDIYRLSVGADNTNFNTAQFPNTFLGVKSDSVADTRLYWNRTEADGDYVNWYFVSEADGLAFAKTVEVYNLAEQLRTLIAEAEGKSLDVAAQKAVYLNEDATKEEVEAAITGVKDVLAKAEEGATTADKPLDKTLLITNPSYETNKNDGWKGDAPAFQSYTNAEFYNKNFNYYQDITGAPKGVYAVEVQAYYRAGNSGPSYENYQNSANYNAKLYAKTGTDSINTSIVNPFSQPLTTAKGMNESKVTAADGTELYIANNMETAAAYFKDGLYNNKLFFATEDGDMRIGLKKDSLLSGDWTLFDNWKLTYYGTGADAYAMWLAEAKKGAKNFDNLPASQLVTEGMVEAYKEKIDGLQATNRQEVLDAVKTIDAEGAAIDANMQAWKQYQAALEKGRVTSNNPDVEGPDKEILADYCDLEAEDILQALALNTEEVNAETAKVLDMNDKAVKNGIKPGADVTDKYLVNANFEKTIGTQAETGWIVKKANNGNVAYGGNNENHCFEAWNNGDFDIYQEVKDAPMGVYELSVQGFYRYGRGDNAWNHYSDGTASNDAVDIYVNNKVAHFKSVFDEHVTYNGNRVGELYKDEQMYVNPDSTYWYPDGMTSSAVAFKGGLYRVSSYGVVARQGDVLRVGVKGKTNQLGDSWAIWDNFQMTFQGTEPDKVKPILEDQLAANEALVQSTEPMGKSILAEANAAIEKAKAVDKADGKAMFAELTALLNTQDSVNTSIALFKQLNAKKEELTQEYAISPAADLTKTEAGVLLESIETGLSDKSLENADAKTYINKVDDMVAKLKIPADVMNATDDNPVDLTSVIRTASFEKDGANSTEGWNADGSSFGNDDTQKAGLLLEFYNKNFDLNQTLKALPAGTYEISVQSFYRSGASTDEYNKYQGDNNLKGNAYMYAVVGNDTIKTEGVALGVSAAVQGDPGYAGIAQIGETGYYIPNTLACAGNFFADDAYVNKMIVKVTDGTLTIGLKKDVLVTNDWTALDNWKLTYFGPNSKKEPTATGIDGVEENVAGTAVKTEIFNINGAKKSSLTRGINIVKTTMSNGTVKVSKVLVK